MRFKLNHVLKGILLVASASTCAETTNGQAATNDLSSLTTYLQNLGQYFGYDLTEYCTTGGSCSPRNNGNNGGGGSGGYSNALFNQNDTYAVELNLFNSYLGALIGGGNSSNSQSSNPNPNPIVPTSSSNSYSIVDSLAGQTYLSPPYSTSSTDTISVSTLIDQQTYQADPVSQAVLNILSTPNYTYCQNTNAQTYSANCPYLFREYIMANVIGTLPGTQTIFSADYNQHLVGQLNSDSLISPLLYSTTALPNSSYSAGTNGKQNAGLTAQTQEQQAANFIRYVTSATNPVSLLTRSNYDNLVAIAENYTNNGTVTPQQQISAKNRLNNYLTKLRTYAAQSSVPIGNLYYILSKRMPQKPVSGTGSPSSQALNEFVMASWRLYNPNAQSGSSSSNQQQWLTQINQGSAASVQKEIAILLAEINYQLYLTRQQQERMLLTQSMHLLEATLGNQPGADLLNDVDSDSASSSTPKS